MQGKYGKGKSSGIMRIQKGKGKRVKWVIRRKGKSRVKDLKEIVRKGNA